ncbi:DMT family transporter [Paenibacillus sp. 1011MAR3C5]|uniref:DMT family transporter n=1 Tax=Paenibacillus sp. 1011MAR3C5 TaxID=1675787 RepID=UPI000E6BD923|nr:DMT family transporter [Paenibacillus sp. 1011MAR3C5]RJE88985.1 DMT family transporter [Paenibacillus sp. 1011MAR3C5]
MWLAIAIGSAILFGLAGWWMKVSQMRGGSTRMLLLALYTAGTAGFGIHAAIEGSIASLTDIRVWAAGLVIGAGSAWGNALFMKALEHGPASLTSPLTNLNIVLVVALATLWYHEPLSLPQGLGVALLMLSVMLIAYKRKEPLTIKEKRWFLLVGLAILMFTLRNGGLKVTDELGMASAPVLFVAYALSIAWFLIPSSEIITPASRRIGLKLGLAAGLFSYGGLQLYAVAITTGQANLAAPIFATNSLVVAIGSILLYKEKLSLQQWAAFLFMLAGLIVIKM